MDKLVAAAVAQVVGLALIVLSVAMLLLTGGDAWFYALALGVLVAVIAFFYLGAKGRPAKKRLRGPSRRLS
jgi:O-antigen/teichoic acid export membrane protein